MAVPPHKTVGETNPPHNGQSGMDTNKMEIFCLSGSLRSINCYKKLSEYSASVFKAENKETGEEVAIKRLSLEFEENGIPIEFYRELNILKEIKHENIIQLKEVVIGNTLRYAYLVLENCDEDLGKVVDDAQIVLTQPEVKNIMRQLFSGLKILHNSSIVHRDIKPCNLLLNRFGLLKISDFGASRKISSSMTPQIGTMGYQAPEVVLELGNYTSAIDIWSAGCVMGELLLGKSLFANNSLPSWMTSVIDLLGTPNNEVLPGFSSSQLATQFTLKEQPYNWVRKVFRGLTDDGISLLKSLLYLDYRSRPRAEDCHRFVYFEKEPKECADIHLKFSIFHRKHTNEHQLKQL